MSCVRPALASGSSGVTPGAADADRSRGPSQLALRKDCQASTSRNDSRRHTLKSPCSKAFCVCSGEEVSEGFERTESKRESNQATSARRAAMAWHMQICAEPRVASRNPETKTPNR